jgi:hypothetical protein
MIVPLSPKTPQTTLGQLSVQTKEAFELLESLRHHGPMFVAEAKYRVGKKTYDKLIANKEIILRLSNHGDCVVLNGVKHHSNLFGKGACTHQHNLKTLTLDHLLIMRDAMATFAEPGDILERISVPTMLIRSGPVTTCVIVSIRVLPTERVRQRLLTWKKIAIQKIIVVSKQERTRRYVGFDIPVEHRHWTNEPRT